MAAIMTPLGLILLILLLLLLFGGVPYAHFALHSVGIVEILVVVLVVMLLVYLFTPRTYYWRRGPRL